jgi:hypothetical protein
VLSLPPSVRDAWLEFAWSMSNGYFVGPKLDRPLAEAKLLDASCFLNHSSRPCLGFSGDYNMVAIRDIAVGEMITYDYAMSEWRVFGACEFKDTSFVILKQKKTGKKGKKGKKDKKDKKKKDKKKKDNKDEKESSSSSSSSNDPFAPFSDFREFVSVDDYKIPGACGFFPCLFLSSQGLMQELQERYKGHFLSSVQRLLDLHKAPVGEKGFRELSDKVELRDHPVKVIGKGLFAASDIPKGHLVWRSNGIESIFRSLDEINAADEVTKVCVEDKLDFWS